MKGFSQVTGQLGVSSGTVQVPRLIPRLTKPGGRGGRLGGKEDKAIRPLQIQRNECFFLFSFGWFGFSVSNKVSIGNLYLMHSTGYKIISEEDQKSLFWLSIKFPCDSSVVRLTTQSMEASRLGERGGGFCGSRGSSLGVLLRLPGLVG